MKSIIIQFHNWLELMGLVNHPHMQYMNNKRYQLKVKEDFWGYRQNTWEMFSSTPWYEITEYGFLASDAEYEYDEDLDLL